MTNLKNMTKVLQEAASVGYDLAENAISFGIGAIREIALANGVLQKHTIELFCQALMYGFRRRADGDPKDGLREAVEELCAKVESSE